MKFHAVLLASVLGLLEYSSAFSPSRLVGMPQSCTEGAASQLVGEKKRQLEPSRSNNRKVHCPRSYRTCRNLASSDDDDDDEDDDDEYDVSAGPLKDGVDSVSWLPSVIGAKGDNMPITSAKEVRHMKARKSFCPRRWLS
jgi:hypothetical protein